MTNVLMFQTSAPTPDLSEPTVHLTPRQLDVLRLLCTGKPNKVIGRKLGIAGATVKVHVSCILRMLKVDSRLQAVLKAHALGLVPIEQSGRGSDDSAVSAGSSRTPQLPTPAASAPVRVMPFAQVAAAAE